MGLLELQRLMSLQRDRRRRLRRTRHRNGLVTPSVCKRKGSPCQQDGDGHSRAAKITRYLTPDLPEDIWHHIHSLMPLHDAARAACLSRAFLHSWRCYPNLTLNRYALRSKPYGKRDFDDKVDRILRNHAGKILKLELSDVSLRCLNSWLHVAVTPGIEELTVEPHIHIKTKYNFPCSLFSEGVRNSIRYLCLGFCAFSPTAELGPLRKLTRLHLCTVHITGDELDCLLSNTLGLQQLVLFNCDKIIRVKIPCVLQQLTDLTVSYCWRLRVIKSKAPNLSSLSFTRKPKLSLGETWQKLKKLTVSSSEAVCYARTELPSIMPNLEILDISSDNEEVNTPMLPTKFLCLKHLSISMTSALDFSPSYDYFSLVSFLDASPFLETLILDVSQECMKHKSVFGRYSPWRQMPEHRHCCLKSVKITGFSSAKSLVELACYIVKNAVSLECLTLDTLYGFRCSGENDKKCLPMSDGILREAPRAAKAIRSYIKKKVPPTVRFTVLEPCSRCHSRRP
ncbi:hypothetical protein ACP4OV_018331 [Aristida adscensionis]